MNNNKIYRILGRRGNTTIPYEIRKKCGFSRNDLISFEEHDQNTVIIRHEKVCDGCGKLNLNEKKRGNAPRFRRQPFPRRAGRDASASLQTVAGGG